MAPTVEGIRMVFFVEYIQMEELGMGVFIRKINIQT